MKFGCCINLDGILENSGYVAVQLMRAGYDYVELPLVDIHALSDSEFEKLVKIKEKNQIVVYSCNICFPGEIKLVGNQVDPRIIATYMDQALERATRLGVNLIVIGSGGSRNIPEGYDTEEAWQQLVETFCVISDKCRLYNNITAAIEPLCKNECNLINTLDDGSRLIKRVERSNIDLIADYYHMSKNEEEISLVKYSDIIKHVHFADPDGRVFPKELKSDFMLFFDELKSIGYNNAISMECGSDDLLTDAINALKIMHEAFSKRNRAKLFTLNQKLH